MTGKIFSIDEIKTIINPIASKYEVERVYLFGSYAKGDARDTSDLDFIIDKGGLRGLKFAGLLCDLRESFDKNVDLLTTAGLSENSGADDFKQNIEKESVVVYEQ